MKSSSRFHVNNFPCKVNHKRRRVNLLSSHLRRVNLLSSKHVMHKARCPPNLHPHPLLPYLRSDPLNLCSTPPALCFPVCICGRSSMPPPIPFSRIRFSCSSFAQLRHCLFASLAPSSRAMLPLHLACFPCVDGCLPPPMAFARVRYCCAFAQLRHSLFASLAPSSRAMLPFTLASCALSMCRWLLASSDGVPPGPLQRRLRPAPPLSFRLPRSLVRRDAALYPCILRAFPV